MNTTKINKRDEIKRLMELHSISADALARELKVTTQTIYNMRRGNVSDQLMEHALLVLDNWEEAKCLDA